MPAMNGLTEALCEAPRLDRREQGRALGQCGAMQLRLAPAVDCPCREIQQIRTSATRVSPTGGKIVGREQYDSAKILRA